MILTDKAPTAEIEASENLLASIKQSKHEAPSVVGRRLVSEKEWLMLQQEVSISVKCHVSNVRFQFLKQFEYLLIPFLAQTERFLSCMYILCNFVCLRCASQGIKTGVWLINVHFDQDF